jgi:beta-glucosidase
LQVGLKPGGSKTVSFTITPDDLKFFNGEEYLTEPGDFHIWIAKDSDSGAYKKFTIAK